MDLAYLRSHPQHLPTFLTHQRIRETPVGGGSICQARRLTLEDGASVFMKFLNDPTDTRATRHVPPDFFETEAEGLRWLREAHAVGVPEVIAVLPEMLVLEWIDPGQPSPGAAERFGRELAATHRAGEVDPVVVTASMRGRGIGRALLAKVADEARRRGLHRLTVSPSVRDVAALRTLHTSGFGTVSTVTLSYDLAATPGGAPPPQDATLALYDLHFSV